MSQFKKDLISSFVFLAFGALVLIAVPLTIKDPGVSVMGPQVFPTFIGVCMVALSLALLAVTLVKHRKEAAAREQAGRAPRGEEGRPAGRAARRGAGPHRAGLFRPVPDPGLLPVHLSGHHGPSCCCSA